MAMVSAKSNPKKLGPLVAGIGALVGIMAFLLLPYLKLIVTAGATGSYPYSPPPSQSVSITVGAGYVSAFASMIWLEALLAIAVVVLSALLLLRENPFGASITPIETQIRRLAFAMIGLGVFAIIYHFLFISFIGSAQIWGMIQSITVGTYSVGDQLKQYNISASISMENAVGAWIYLLCMGAIIVGGVLMLQPGSRQAVSQPQAWNQFPQVYSPPGQPQPQTWSQPLQPQPQAWPQPQDSQPQAWSQPLQPQPQAWQQPSQPIPQVQQQMSQPLPQVWPPQQPS
jgi:hypothetical protein